MILSVVYSKRDETLERNLRTLNRSDMIFEFVGHKWPSLNPPTMMSGSETDHTRRGEVCVCVGGGGGGGGGREIEASKP